MKLHAAVPAICIILCAAPAIAADTVDAAARSTARKLGAEAIKLYEAGDYAAALEKFNTADSLVPAPTLGLYAARCLVKLGKLVEASERYLEVTRMQLDRYALPVMRKAQVDAVAERDKLLPTVPSLEILLEGPKGSGVELIVDGKTLVAGLIGEKRPINPGKHHVEAKRADISVTQDVDIRPSDAAHVLLKLPALPAPPEERMPAMRKVGWAGIGLAGAGVIAGGTAGLIAIAKGQSLLTKCPNHVCTSQADFANAGPYNAARIATTAGFIAGAVGLAVGIPLLVASPKSEWVYPDGRPAPPPGAAPKAALETWITWGSAGLRGSF